MNVLGSLFVQLKANTADFVDGMSRASYSAKRTSRDIEDSFSRLGSLAGSLLAPFGETGQLLGESLSRVGEWGAKAAEGIGKMSGGLSFLTIGAGTGAAAIAALDAASIGLAIHATEGAAKLFILSQTTGVSVEALSGLSFAAKMTGVDQETLAKGLEKLDKSMLKNATSAPGTVDAFTRLGVAVRGTDGQIRSTEDVFADLAEKFSQMQNGAVKTGLAIEIFGRGGAAMVPLLNEGKQGIEEFLDTARALGLILDTDTAAAAEHFRDNLETIEEAGHGISLRFMKDLLPALETVTHELVEGLKDSHSAINAFVDDMAWMAKASIAVAGTVTTAFRSIKAAGAGVVADLKADKEFFATLSAFGLGEASWDDVKKAYHNVVETEKKDSKDFSEYNKKLWKDNADFIENMMGPRAPWTLSHRGDRGNMGDVDTKPARQDTVLERIRERINALALEREGWLKIGQAGSQAAQLIAEASKKGDEEFGKLRAEAAKSKTPEALKLVDANEGAIKAAGAAATFGGAIKGIIGDLDKQGRKFDEEAAASDKLAQAYRNGGVASAVLDGMLAEQSAKVLVLKQAHDQLAEQLGEESPQVKQLADGLALANEELEENKKKLSAALSSKLSTELDKETASYAALRPFVAAIADAHLQSAAAVRAETVAMQLQAFIRDGNDKGVALSSELIERQRQLLQAKSDDAYRDATIEEASRYDLITSYAKEIERIGDLRAVLLENHQSTMLLDAEEYDFQARMIQQWDQAAMKVGSLGDKFRATMNEVALQGRNFSGKVFEAFGKAIDDVSTQLAKLVVTGKANFRELFQGLEESIVKAGFQTMIGKAAGFINNKFFGGAIPGLGQKADGSQASPFYVVPVDASGNIFGSMGGGGLWGGSATKDNGGIWDESIPGLGGSDQDGGGGGMFGGLFGKIGSIFSSAFSGIFSFFGKIASGIGGAFSSIFSFFGGFLANGGDVTPGRAYIVGEKHPEFFVPRQAGQVAPALQMGSSQQYSYQFHFHGVQDFDSFKKSKGQMMADFQRQLSLAHGRNR